MSDFDDFAVTVHGPFPGVVAMVRSALSRHGFVDVAELDLRAELLRRAGAYLPPYVLMLVVNPATTVRVLRRDPGAADLTVLAVSIRETDAGVLVEVHGDRRVVEPGVADAAAQLRRRLARALRAATPVDRSA